MKSIYTIRIFIAIGFMTMFMACSDYDQSEPDMTIPENSFEGNIIDFLSSSKVEEFDSILNIVENIPELKAELSRTDKDITLFAPTDRSVRNAINALNNYRRSNGIGGPVYLKDLLIEPFFVEDTTIIVNRFTLEEDTTFTKRKFDYRLQMDSLVSRYCFAEAITSDKIIEVGGASKRATSRNTLEMVIEGGRHNASGAVGAGAKYLRLVETNGSNLQSSWVKAEVASRDISTKNGMVHILDNNHEFAFNLFIKNFKNRGTEKGVKVIR